MAMIISTSSALIREIIAKKSSSAWHNTSISGITSADIKASHGDNKLLLDSLKLLRSASDRLRDALITYSAEYTNYTTAGTDRPSMSVVYDYAKAYLDEIGVLEAIEKRMKEAGALSPLNPICYELVTRIKRGDKRLADGHVEPVYQTYAAFAGIVERYAVALFNGSVVMTKEQIDACNEADKKARKEKAEAAKKARAEALENGKKALLECGMSSEEVDKFIVQIATKDGKKVKAEQITSLVEMKVDRVNQQKEKAAEQLASQIA